MKTIIITGASSGIGYELANLYAKPKTTLILIARRKDRLENIKSLCQKKGATVEIFEHDMSSLENTKQLAENIGNKFSTIDLIILNAGISLGHKSKPSPYEDYEYLYRVNFLSNIAFLDPILEKLKKQKSGQIVFISSLASIITMPSSLAYSSSKRALNAYAEGLRYQLLPFKINITIIKPGFIKSELTDKNSFKMPFLLELENGTKRIYNAIETKKIEFTFPKRFYYLILFLKYLPNFIKDKIILSKAKKVL